MNAAHIGVQNEWKAAVLVWRSCCSQTFIICCKHDMQIRFDDNFSANHRPPETDWKQTIEMLFPFLEMCNPLYTHHRSLIHSIIPPVTHRANMTQQFHPTNRWFCALCTIRHRHATINTSCKWPTILEPQNGRRVTQSVYDRNVTTEAIVQNNHPQQYRVLAANANPKWQLNHQAIANKSQY